MNDLFRYVKEEREEVLYRYSNTAKKLRDDGARQFLLPGSAAGVFLIILGSILSKLFKIKIVVTLTYALSFLGAILAVSSTVLFAMFVRMSRQASGTTLYITNKNVVWCEGGRYAKLPLADITDAKTARAHRFERIPFDMSALEHEYLVLFYRGGDMKIPFVEHPDDAAKKIMQSLPLPPPRS